MVRRISRIVFYWLSFVIKPKKVLVFTSFPDFADNPYALYLYLIKNQRYDEYKKVWIISNPRQEIIDKIREIDNRTIISSYTLKNWYYVLMSRYIFSSHNAYSYLHFHQNDKLMNLWHGLGIKKIGYDNGETPSTFYGNSVYTLATSPFFIECMSSAFRIPKEHVLLTGLPRNDLLFENSARFAKILNGNQYNSVGIWMPTFRQTSDGNLNDAPMNKGAINYWNPLILEEINDFLIKTNNFLILKLHPADSLQKTELGKYSNLCILRNEDLPARELYPLIGKTDYLISDYSSVFVDYMTLKKPMGFLQNDTETYKEGRALYFEPTADNLPGHLLYNLEDMKDFIFNHKQYGFKKKEFLNIFADASNCKRLVEKLNL